MSSSNAITTLLQQAIAQKHFPGCALSVTKSNTHQQYCFGNLTYDPDSPLVSENTIYDVASITKVIPTSTLFSELVTQKQINLDHPLIKYLPLANGGPLAHISIKQFVSHTVPYTFSSSRLKDLSADQIIHRILHDPLQHNPLPRVQYANANAIILSLIIEAVVSQPFAQFAQQTLFAPLQMHQTTFQPGTELKQHIAPTEEDPWRKNLVHGVVHDESAYTLSQKYDVGSAGLFSTTKDLQNFSQMLLQEGSYANKQVLHPLTVARLNKNLVSDLNDYMGFGYFLQPNLQLGNTPSPQAYGKRGFTGCLVLIDPAKNIAMTMFSNHIHPHRKDSLPIYTLQKELCDIVFS